MGRGTIINTPRHPAWASWSGTNLDVRFPHDLDSETGLSDNSATSARWTGPEHRAVTAPAVTSVSSAPNRGNQLPCRHHSHTLLPTSVAPMGNIFAELIVWKRFLNSSNIVHHAKSSFNLCWTDSNYIQNYAQYFSIFKISNVNSM